MFLVGCEPRGEEFMKLDAEEAQEGEEEAMGRSVMKLAVLECERLQDHLAPAVFHRTGGYLQLLQNAFAHVVSHASTILHPQITVPPSLSFTGSYHVPCYAHAWSLNPTHLVVLLMLGMVVTAWSLPCMGWNCTLVLPCSEVVVCFRV
jgi:hypothetical protein